MDIILGGEGFGFKVQASTAQKKDRQHFFKVDDVKVKIKNLRINIKKSNHKLLYTFFKPLLYGVVRPVLERVLAHKVKELFDSADAFAYEVQQEAKRNKKLAEQSEDNESEPPNTSQRYIAAVRHTLDEKKKESEKKAGPPREGKVNVATTYKESIFPNIQLPDTLSYVATWYEKLASEGNRWESPVFSVGSASESNFSSPTTVHRKAHKTTEGKLKDRELPETNGATSGTNGSTTAAVKDHINTETNGSSKKNIGAVADAINDAVTS